MKIIQTANGIIIISYGLANGMDGWNPCLEECEASQSDRKDNPQMAITKRRGHLYKKCEQISVYFDCGPVKWPETLVTRS